MRKNTDHVNYTDLGKRIKKKREAAGLKQEKVAEQISADISTISKIETGTTKVSLPTLLLLANLLNASADELLCGSKGQRSCISGGHYGTIAGLLGAGAAPD